MAELREGVSELEEDTQKDKYLTFTVGKEVYGLEIRYVTEIIGIQEITEVPEFPEYVKGIINLRGKIIPVIDVRLKFGKELRSYDDRTCIIVTDINGMPIGLVVDRVFEVLSIPEQDVIPLPEVEMTVRQKFVSGIGKVGNDVKLLLDCEKLINDDEMSGMDIELA